MTTSAHLLYAALALIASLTGLLFLFLSWDRKNRSRLLVGGGWSLFTLSLVFWAFAAGPDRGVAIGLIIFSFAGLSIIGGVSMNKPANAKKKRSVRVQTASQDAKFKAQTVSKFLGSVLFLGPICGTITFAITMGIYTLADLAKWHEADSLVFALFLFPILWAAVIAVSLISVHQRAKRIFFISAPILSAILIFNGLIFSGSAA